MTDTISLLTVALTVYWHRGCSVAADFANSGNSLLLLAEILPLICNTGTVSA